MRSVSRLTRKGQLTIPKRIRDALGFKPHDEIEVELVDGEVRLRKARLSLNEIAGSVPPIDVPLERAIHLAKEERARRKYRDSLIQRIEP
ncbi:MAG: AbrB/MazE/SpoVT family DNA-binding domain-containing protein [Thermomicrobiales bacterium]